MKYKGLDLYTLEFVKSMFMYHSDLSTHTHGYRHLCNTIKEAKKFNSNKREVLGSNECKDNKFIKICDLCEENTEHRIIHVCLKCDSHL